VKNNFFLVLRHDKHFGVRQLCYPRQVTIKVNVKRLLRTNVISKLPELSLVELRRSCNSILYDQFIENLLISVLVKRL